MTGQLAAFATSFRRRLRRSEEHTSELQSRQYLVCRLLLEKKECIQNRQNIGTGRDPEPARTAHPTLAREARLYAGVFCFYLRAAPQYLSLLPPRAAPPA